MTQQPHPTAVRLREMADQIDKDAFEMIGFIDQFTDGNRQKLKNQSQALRSGADHLRRLADKVLPHGFQHD